MMYDPDVLEDAAWLIPDEYIGSMEDARTWWHEQSLASCPYYIVSNGGPTLEGRYGPGTCIGGCWEEPTCMTSFEPGRTPRSGSE